MSPTPQSPLPKLYAEALRTYVSQPGNDDFTTAHQLGRQALANELSTLEMAKIHDNAVVSLIPAGCRSEFREALIAQASHFFNEALIPIESSVEQHPTALAQARSVMKHEPSNGQSTAAALAVNKEAADTLLAESLQLEAHLKDIVRQLFTTKEEAWKKKRLQLQDEISQTLLGIHVRLLALKNEVAASNEEIATTQRLVEESTDTIRRYARELGLPHEG